MSHETLEAELRGQLSTSPVPEVGPTFFDEVHQVASRRRTRSRIAVSGATALTAAALVAGVALVPRMGSGADSSSSVRPAATSSATRKTPAPVAEQPINLTGDDALASKILPAGNLLPKDYWYATNIKEGQGEDSMQRTRTTPIASSVVRRDWYSDIPSSGIIGIAPFLEAKSDKNGVVYQRDRLPKSQPPAALWLTSSAGTSDYTAPVITYRVAVFDTEAQAVADVDRQLGAHGGRPGPTNYQSHFVPAPWPGKDSADHWLYSFNGVDSETHLPFNETHGAVRRVGNVVLSSTVSSDQYSDGSPPGPISAELKQHIQVAVEAMAKNVAAQGLVK